MLFQTVRNIELLNDFHDYSGVCNHMK